MKQTIILINGAKRSGKDFTATLISDILSKKSSVSIMKFADPMKDILSRTLGISEADLETYKNNSDYCIQLKNCNSNNLDTIKTLTLRQLIQNFGTNAMHDFYEDKDVWAEQLYTKAINSKAKYVIVPDLRFIHEHKIFKNTEFNVVTLKIKNDDVINTDPHPSERQMDNYNFDYSIDNTGYSKKLNEYVRSFIENKLD